MDALGPRQFRPSVLLAYAAELERRGILEKVRSRLSPEALQAIDDARKGSWCRGEILDEFHAAVAALQGREAVREIGLALTKEGGIGKVVAPIITFALGFGGGGPDSLLSRLPAMGQIMSRGTAFEWVPRAKNAGTVRLRTETPVPETSWAVWEGILESICEMSKPRGTVARARPAADACGCEIDVEWETKARE